MVLTDAGFGNPSTLGGPIQTLNYTRMADGGVQYNRFHVTALCSPTRAALLTGRNNHYVGFGSVGEIAGGFPGYCATLPRDCAPLPRILRNNGYSTAAIGKWHLTPDGQQGPAGPFDRWPNGWDFDYFYGFLGGGASQWDPCPAENQKIIGTPAEYYDWTRRRRFRGGTFRPAAPCGHCHRRGDRRRWRSTVAQETWESHQREGWRHHPYRWCWAYRGLPAIRGGEGRTRGHPCDTEGRRRSRRPSRQATHGSARRRPAEMAEKTA